MAQATLAADPLAVASAVVVTVEVEAIAVGAEGVAGGIIAMLQAGKRVFVSGVVAELDGAQSLQVVVGKEEDIVEALTGIADHFADDQTGEAAAQIVEARDGLEMVVAVGGDERAGRWAKGQRGGRRRY